MRRARQSERLLAVIAFTALLFTPPILLIFDRHGRGDVSWLALYLFIAWLLVITLVAWLMERPGDR